MKKRKCVYKQKSLLLLVVDTNGLYLRKRFACMNDFNKKYLFFDEVVVSNSEYFRGRSSVRKDANIILTLFVQILQMKQTQGDKRNPMITMNG